MKKTRREKIIRIGHSPDPDDAFMFYALSKGMVGVNGFRIEHVIEDIQSLNRRARRAELEVTAISAAVYPLIQKNYWILSCGASVGRNYGPIVVSRNGLSAKELKGKRIAIPGNQTTACLLLKFFCPDYVPVETSFEKIIPAVRAGQVDAGLVIHEGQLNFGSFGVRKCLDLGNLWWKKYGLPIPLGLDVVRKDLGKKRAHEINRALRESIRFALENESAAIAYASKFSRGLPTEATKQFVGMYVNAETLQLSGAARKALKILFRIGAERGIFPTAPRAEFID